MNNRTSGPGPDDRRDAATGDLDALSATELDEFLALLAAAPRRRTIRALDRAGTWLSVESLVEAVVAGEARPDAARRERVRLSLEHVHLPKLSAANVVDWDPDAAVVGPTPWTGQLGRLLDRLDVRNRERR